MKKLFLLPFLLLATACGGDEPAPDDNVRLGGGTETAAGPSANGANPPGTPAGGVEEPPANAANQNPVTPVSSIKVPENGAAAMADQGIQNGERPLLPSGYKASDQGPKRDPQFNFEPGGPIKDEQLTDYYVEMFCSIDGKPIGNMTFELWGDKAPITVRNWLRYCDEGFYDGLAFHRILRDFMLQGGDPLGDGSGDGTYGRIKGEMGTGPAREHGYGVLSMARGRSVDSASCQFFLCCAESQPVWNLDTQYASFGKMTTGVATLELMAMVPTTKGRSGEPSMPMRRVLIDQAVVRKGVAPKGEKIERPPIDLKGEPEKVTVRHVLISFKGAIPTAERSKEEAEKLAKEVLQRAKDGEDFDKLIRTYTDDNILDNDPAPGSYFMTNKGISDKENFLVLKEVNEKHQDDIAKKMDELRALIQAKKLEIPEAEKKLAEYQRSLYPPGFYQAKDREKMVKGFGDISFSLKVGEIGVANYNPQDSKYGWHIIKRIK